MIAQANPEMAQHAPTQAFGKHPIGLLQYEAAQYIGVPLKVFRQMIAEGRFIDGVVFCRRAYYPVADVDLWKSCGYPTAQEFKSLKQRRNLNLVG